MSQVEAGQPMTTILITGCTGFVGSAIAACLLGAGLRVLALSRNDPDGQRTRASVRDAAEGFELSLGAALDERLSVIEVEAERYSRALSPQLLSDVGAAWHVAAEMSYASLKSLDAYQANVVATCELYRHLAEQAPGCRRFFHVSTAYTAGMLGGPVDEELHAGQPYENAYQLSKSMAEHALANLSQRQRLPVTLFRPTIVVGHARTGWARRNGHGMHMFIEAFASIGRAGIDRINLSLNGLVRPDFVPIDRLAADVLGLTTRRDAGEPLEIFHCAGGLGSTLEEVLRTLGRPSGVEVSIGEPQSRADRRLNRAIQWNRNFANTEWQFSCRRLASALGRARPPALSLEELDRITRWYLDTDRERGSRVRDGRLDAGRPQARVTAGAGFGVAGFGVAEPGIA